MCRGADWLRGGGGILAAEDIVEDEITECMICLENLPNTMVLPCGHCVVCKECSEKLENTNDARTCVRCRRDITHILD